MSQRAQFGAEKFDVEEAPDELLNIAMIETREIPAQHQRTVKSRSHSGLSAAHALGHRSNPAIVLRPSLVGGRREKGVA